MNVDRGCRGLCVQRLLVLMLALSLAACGGGGSSSPSAGASGGSGAAAGSSTGSGGGGQGGAATGTSSASPTPQLAALNQLNAMRTMCGFPALAENAQLDQAASAHVAWMQDNATFSHTETAGTPGYTGATPPARATAAGYTGSLLSEVIGSEALHAAAPGAQAIVGLASVPYHLAAMFISANDIGIGYGGFSPTAGQAASYNVLVADLGAASAVPKYVNAPLTFPCQGATGLAYASTAQEIPAPLGINTGANPIGTPIALLGNYGDVITLTSGSLRGPSGSTTPLNLLDAANDANHELSSYEAVAFSSSPLSPGTSYVATLVGTYNGLTFTRQFSFTTGS